MPSTTYLASSRTSPAWPSGICFTASMAVVSSIVLFVQSTPSSPLCSSRSPLTGPAGTHSTSPACLVFPAPGSRPDPLRLPRSRPRRGLRLSRPLTAPSSACSPPCSIHPSTAPPACATAERGFPPPTPRRPASGGCPTRAGGLPATRRTPAHAAFAKSAQLALPPSPSLRLRLLPGLHRFEPGRRLVVPGPPVAAVRGRSLRGSVPDLVLPLPALGGRLRCRQPVLRIACAACTSSGCAPAHRPVHAQSPGAAASRLNRPGFPGG